MDQDEIQHYRDLIKATRARLARLEIQKAQFGFATPPHIDNDIAQAHRDIELYAAKLTVGTLPSQQAQDDVDGDPQAILIEAQIKQVGQQQKDGLTVLQSEVTRLAEIVARMDARSEAYRTGERQIRNERQQEHDERMTAMETQANTLSSTVDRLAEQVYWTPWHVAAIVAIGAIITIIAVWIVR